MKQQAALEQRISEWTHIQALFMPFAIACRGYNASPTQIDSLQTASDDPDDNLDLEDDPNMASGLGGVDAEMFELMLPSHPTCVSRGFADSVLTQTEVKVRLARLEASLSEIRHLLRIRTSVYLDKKAHSVGQKSGTRSHILMTTYNKKLEATHHHYKEDRQAAMSLDPGGGWMRRYQELKKADLRAAHEDENRTLTEGYVTATRAPGEAQRQLSWIWKVPLLDHRRVALAVEHTPETRATQEEVSECQYDPVIELE